MSLVALAENWLELNLVKPAEELENDYFFVEELRFRKGRVHVFKSKMLPATLICKLIQSVLPKVDWVILVNLRHLNYAYLGKLLDETSLEKILVTSDTSFSLLERISRIKNSVIISFNVAFFVRHAFHFLLKKISSTYFLFFLSPVKRAKSAYTVCQVNLIGRLAYSVSFEKSKDPLLAQHVYNFSICI